MPLMSPVRFSHVLIVWVGLLWKPPSWSRTTIERTFCAFRIPTYLLIVSASSAKRIPWTAEGTTIVGVVSVARPMKPTLTPPTVLTL